MIDDFDTSQRRVILIEEFPTLSGQRASTLDAFRLSILRYISMNDPTAQGNHDCKTGVPPIVIVVSEASTNTESPFENLSAHRLLGRQIYNHPSTTVIEFNSIASTIMHKALNSVLKKSARQPANNQIKTKTILDSISKIGDIRNAISSLEFICLKNGTHSPLANQTVNTPITSRGHKRIMPVGIEALEAISQRGASIGMYHAVGKIVYNKRNDSSGTDQLQLPSPPDHLRDHNRPKVSPVQVNELLDDSGTDVQSLIGALHENYVPSCHGPSFTGCLDGCMEFLSDSDILGGNRKDSSRSMAGFGPGFFGLGTSVDALRQEEMSYQVAARGLLFALPCPVKRQLSSTNHVKRTDDVYKLFFCPRARLIRQFEETQIHIDSWVDAMLNSTLRPTSVPLPIQGHVASHKTIPAWKDNSQISCEESSNTALPLMTHNELILDHLPYTAKILGNAAESEDLKKIVSFTGSHGAYYSSQQEQSALESSLEVCGALESSRGDRQSGRFLEPEAALMLQMDDEQLFLSDDDIVDAP